MSAEAEEDALALDDVVDVLFLLLGEDLVHDSVALEPELLVHRAVLRRAEQELLALEQSILIIREHRDLHVIFPQPGLPRIVLHHVLEDREELHETVSRPGRAMTA